jgi:hypothetical protein
MVIKRISPLVTIAIYTMPAAGKERPTRDFKDLHEADDPQGSWGSSGGKQNHGVICSGATDLGAGLRQ